MACPALTHEISGRKYNNQLVCLTKDSRSWPHMSKRTTDEVTYKTFASPSRKNNEKENVRKKTRMANAKLFALHVNAKMKKWKLTRYRPCSVFSYC